MNMISFCIIIKMSNFCICFFVNNKIINFFYFLINQCVRGGDLGGGNSRTNDLDLATPLWSA